MPVAEGLRVIRRSSRQIEDRAAARVLGAILSLCSVAGPSRAATAYEPIVEWNGPYLHVIHAPAVNQLVDTPFVDIAFSAPRAVAAREHSTGGRDVVYVVDSDHNRVQAFEANATYVYTNQSYFTWIASAAAASQWDSDEIRLAEWAATATRFVVPYSETVQLNGHDWSYVASLTGFTAADSVYTIDWTDATNAPVLLFPASSLASSSSFSLRYVISDEQTGASASFGTGDIDYGVGAGASPVLVEIDEGSGGPTSWQTLRSLAVTQNEVTSTTDDLFLLDAADNSGSQNEELFWFTVSDAGTVTYQESYDDLLTTPHDVAIARSGTSTAATLSLSSDAGPFDQATASIVDASQVTGHIYDVTVSGLNCTITDRTTGRILVNAAPFTTFANPYKGIPGLSLPTNFLLGSSIVITTTRWSANRYLFLADTGADRIKVVAAADGAPASWPGDWLPGDQHVASAQPVLPGTIGATADTDYRYTTPSTVPEDYSVFTSAFPVEEGSLNSITFDPSGTPVTWTRVDDLSSQTPTTRAYTVDLASGKIVFGDDIHGMIPPANTAFQFNFVTSVDVLRYGSTGNDPGEFSAPKGIAARWNASLGVYDVYVADSGNDRIQKLAFYPGNTALHVPPRVDFVCEWDTASEASDLLNDPRKIRVTVDGESPANVWLAVADAANNRVVIYKDLAAMASGGTTIPAFDHVMGGTGSSLGQYQSIDGVAWLPHGTGLDLYTTDATRNMVTKYEEAPSPSISLSFTGASALPNCFAPTGNYTFSFVAENAPDGAYVDFYYDTASVYSSSTAELCLPSESVPATATHAAWPFADSPGGAPAENDGYYLYARLKSASGTLLAADQTTADELLCLSGERIASLSGLDGVDGDRTLYLQSGSDRLLHLAVAYPESVIAAGWKGTFDPDLIEVVSITAGTGWAGTGYINQVFTQSFNNTTGTFSVNSSVTGSPFGLVAPGPHTLAQVVVRARTNVLSASERVATGSITFDRSTSYLRNIHNQAPASWRAPSVKLRLAYLGDVATTGVGADSVLPHLGPNPDGVIDFEDQIAFTTGWNGVNHVQDPIADLGPASGTTPDLSADPDGLFTLDDILAFTTMFSWAAAARRPAPISLDAGSRSGPLALRAATSDARARLQVEWPDPVAPSTATAELLLESEIAVAGARLTVGFDPSSWFLQDVERRHEFDGDDGALYFVREGDGVVEITISRLDRAAPGATGQHRIARLTFAVQSLAPSALAVDYDLRGVDGKPMARGMSVAEFAGESGQTFRLWPAAPNPTRGEASILFSLPAEGHALLELLDVTGRRLETLADQSFPAGPSAFRFGGRVDGLPLRPGVYFLRLSGGAGSRHTKLVVR